LKASFCLSTLPPLFLLRNSGEARSLSSCGLEIKRSSRRTAGPGKFLRIPIPPCQVGSLEGRQRASSFIPLDLTFRSEVKGPRRELANLFPPSFPWAYQASIPEALGPSAFMCSEIKRSQPSFAACKRAPMNIGSGRRSRPPRPNRAGNYQEEGQDPQSPGPPLVQKDPLPRIPILSMSGINGDFHFSSLIWPELTCPLLPLFTCEFWAI